MYKQLTREQRYTISVSLQNKSSISSIAELLKVSKSTVYREIRRNSNAKGEYRYEHAVLKSRRRKSRNPGNRSVSNHVRGRAFELIRTRQWSPEEVSEWLKKEEGLHVSKSTIYNWISAGSPHFRDNIRKHLRHGGKRSKKRKKGNKIPIPNRISIDERPDSADGSTVGDWEMDTIIGRGGKGAIVTLVDRKSCYLLMKKLKTGKKAEPLADEVIGMLRGQGFRSGR